ncbi:MAG: hypothetical protein AB1410_07065 [Acidobacteriota bacterium]
MKIQWKKVLASSNLMILVSLLALPTPYLMKYIVDEELCERSSYFGELLRTQKDS